MGSGGAKTTNRMLQTQTNRANQIGDVAGERSQAIWDSGRGDTSWGRDALKDMYASLGEGGSGEGGGGGGPAFEKMNFESSTLPFYLKMMNEGGYSEADKANILSYASGPISGLFEGLKRNLQTAQAGRGQVGYGGGLSRLARDQAYETSNLAKGVAGDLAEKILASRFGGAAGATGIESEKRGFEVSERDKAYQAAASAAARGRAGADDDFNRRRALIHDILGLEGDKDLAYMDRQLGANQQAIGSVTGRADETPLWQKGLTSVLPSAASAAVGAFTFPSQKKKKPPINTGGPTLEEQ